MDLHAHTSLSEVMGLIGGFWNPHNKLLMICRYEPCKNLASSTTHCDMCPISQARAVDALHNDNLSILGWFHSHPVFAPEPSQQDIDTQLSLQKLIQKESPCIGIILSPFSSQLLVSSPFRCIIVQRKMEEIDQFVPYKMNVEICSDVNVAELIKLTGEIFMSEVVSTDKQKVNFSATYPWNTSITYLDKVNCF